MQENSNIKLATLQEEQITLIRTWLTETTDDFKKGIRIDANMPVVDIYLSYVNSVIWAAIKAKSPVDELHELRECLFSLGSLLRGYIEKSQLK